MRPARSLAPLVLVLLGALLLRTLHLDTGLPQRRDPDGVIVTQAIGLERRAKGEREHVSSLYPMVLGRAIEALPGQLEPTPPADAPLAEHLAAASRADLVSRTLVAVLSSLAVLAVGLLARRWSTPLGATLAAAFLATSLTHVAFSRMARPHGPVTAFCVLTVLSLAWSLRRPTWPRVLITCVLAGLAVGTLHSGASVLPACLVALIWLLRREGVRLLPRLAVGLTLTAALISAAYPFVADKGVFSVRPMDSPFSGGGLQRFVPRLFASDPVLVLLAAGGLLVLAAECWRRHGHGTAKPRPADPGGARDTAWLCAIHGIAYFVAIAQYQFSWLRFTMLLLPYAALLAALPLDRLARGGRPALALGLGALALTLPGVASARYVSIHGRPETGDLMSEYLAKVATHKDRVAVESLVALPGPHHLGTLKLVARSLRTPWQRYQVRARPTWGRHARRLIPLNDPKDHALRRTPEDLEAVLAKHRPRYAVASLAADLRTVHNPTAEVLAAAGATELVRVESLGSSLGMTTVWRDLEHFLLRYALCADRPGPPLALYELPPGGPER